ncbi:D-alanyl-D-alanine carboxypeptidase DacF precursor [Clostridiales bacterium CHKCI006]|nr:D-alanyl-D-alanine carboxypeptidase DacF precursor [Clostridiales bacterium CHKCI006]
MKKWMLCLTLVIGLCIGAVPCQAEELASQAKAAILIEAKTRDVLFTKSEHERMYPASTTKIMTMILIFEALNEGSLQLDEMIHTSAYAASMGGSQVYLEENEVLPLSDMLKAIAVSSANDCCVAVAEHIAGSSEAFVDMMNKKASELGLKDTHFVNCTGLHDENHYTSAYDLAMMAAYLVEIGQDQLFDLTSLYDAYIREDTDQKFWLVNTNKALNPSQGIDGLKTGFTKEAGYCLVLTGQRDGLRMIAVVLNEEDPKVRNAEATALLESGLAQYTTTTLYRAGDVVTEMDVKHGRVSSAPVISAEDIQVPYPKTETYEPDYAIEIDRDEAPLYTGEVVGYLKLMNEEATVARYPLIVNQDVERISYWSFFKELFGNLLYA